MSTAWQMFKDSEMMQSKKFRAFVIGLLVLGLNEAGVDIDPDLLDRFLILVGGYMGFQMVSDFSPRYNKKSNGK